LELIIKEDMKEEQDMSAKITKVYKEHLPSLRFVGKRYTNAVSDLKMEI
jgi:hypothetical protein